VNLGQATKRLTPFREIVGLDPSDNMIKVALANCDFKSAENQGSSKFYFRRGNAEDLGSAGIDSESVDLVVAGKLHSQILESSDERFFLLLRYYRLLVSVNVVLMERRYCRWHLVLIS
jgi:SAM-dependent methyltransferase